MTNNDACSHWFRKKNLFIALLTTSFIVAQATAALSAPPPPRGGGPGPGHSPGHSPGPRHGYGHSGPSPAAVFGTALGAIAIGTALSAAVSSAKQDPEPATTTIVIDPDSSAVTGGEIIVTSKTLNVRSGPGRQNSVVATVVSGNILQVIGNAPDWYYVRLSDGTSGWVMAKFTASLVNPADG